MRKTILPGSDSTGIACIILDVRMPGSSGLELQDTLKGLESDLPILFLTGHGDIPMSVKAIKGGAVNFLTKPVDETVLLAAVRQALLVHKKKLQDNELTRKARTCLATLTSRELEVMRYILSGVRNRQVATHLDITEKPLRPTGQRSWSRWGYPQPWSWGRVCATGDYAENHCF